MYRPRAYAVSDLAAVRAAIRMRSFATLALAANGVVHLAYAPVALDDTGGLGQIRFHLAKANPLCALAHGARVTASFLGPDAYISPDWYAGEGFVPTWNYIAVEAEGTAERLGRDGLATLLDDLSAAQEIKLLPKPAWTMDKLSARKREMLFAAIEGFVVPFDTLEGKFKLSQDKSAADIEGAIAGLEARGDGASLAVAKAMRKPTLP